MRRAVVLLFCCFHAAVASGCPRDQLAKAERICVDPIFKETDEDVNAITNSTEKTGKRSEYHKHVCCTLETSKGCVKKNLPDPSCKQHIQDSFEEAENLISETFGNKTCNYDCASSNTGQAIRATWVVEVAAVVLLASGTSEKFFHGA